MLLRLAYLAVTNVFAALRLLPLVDRDKDVEILALRHQITVLERQCSTTSKSPPPEDGTNRKEPALEQQAQRPVRLRAQRRPLPDGGRLAHPPGGGPDRGPLRGIGARRPGQPGRGRGDARGRHRHHRRPSKVLTVDAVEASDVVITMGCGDACPIFPGKRYEDWKLDDPAGQGIEAVRPIRDEIKKRVENDLADLLPA
ncbi:hypothetical protein H4W80_010570 [Nonomuraea angiospora]|uniref:Phosphotyrosine protein phosphatase I domain-containing protein n=1 Tax=Nonomuraea angiospora TaxID=46172 RepID=A0ABR9MHE1_9ACTN|nr:hypothetical protein [Nonomuraea angiospora]